MVLEDKHYVPTLAVRASEMNGLEFLPGATKDRMTPCFLLAPWANSHSLDRTITRIERAFPNRNYFLDIDRDYQFTNLESETQRELSQLLVSDESFANWLSFVADHPQIYPCIQTRGQSEIDIRSQIEAIQQLNRPYSVRVVRDRFPDNIDAIINAVAASGTADFAIILEGGWTRDPLSLSLWYSGLISGTLQPIDARVPIVLSCTSIPKMFSEFNSNRPTEVLFTNRELIQQVSRQTNRAGVVYGDWGSTKPRDVGGFFNRPLDRVDYPTSGAWYIARNKDDEWGYAEAAQAILDSETWLGNLGVWGEEMIEQTAINEHLGIDTPQKNVAARVNIHLHQQAFLGEPPIDPNDFDEDWQDDQF